MTFHINSACWDHYPKDALFDLMEAHPLLFPGFTRPSEDWEPSHGPNAIAARPYTDPMGCVWHTADDGIVGTVLGHPLEDQRAFGTTWHIPDPDRTDGLVPRHPPRRPLHDLRSVSRRSAEERGRLDGCDGAVYVLLLMTRKHTPKRKGIKP